MHLTLGIVVLLTLAGCAGSQPAAPVATNQGECERAGGIWRGDRAYCERAGGGGY
jgi:hypothetical protein